MSAYLYNIESKVVRIALIGSNVADIAFALNRDDDTDGVCFGSSGLTIDDRTQQVTIEGYPSPTWTAKVIDLGATDIQHYQHDKRFIAWLPVPLESGLAGYGRDIETGIEFAVDADGCPL